MREEENKNIKLGGRYMDDMLVDGGNWRERGRYKYDQDTWHIHNGILMLDACEENQSRGKLEKEFQQHMEGRLGRGLTPAAVVMCFHQKHPGEKVLFQLIVPARPILVGKSRQEIQTAGPITAPVKGREK